MPFTSEGDVPSGRDRSLRVTASLVAPEGRTEPNVVRFTPYPGGSSDSFRPRTFTASASTGYLPVPALSHDSSPSKDTFNYTHRSTKRERSDFTLIDYRQTPSHLTPRTPSKKPQALREVCEGLRDPQFSLNKSQPEDEKKYREATKLETMLQDTVDGVAAISLDEEKRVDQLPFDTESELVTAPSDIQEICRLVRDYLYSRESENALNLKDVAFQLMKETLLDQFTEKFWRIHDKEWSRNVKTHGNSTSPSEPQPYPSNSGPPARLADRTGRNYRKRSREGEGSDEEVPSDGNDGGNPKRSGRGKPKKKGESPPFACHFRKQDPAKYNLHDWNTCATSSWEEIPRLKYEFVHTTNQ
jgi:hypothetical protein